MTIDGIDGKECSTCLNWIQLIDYSKARKGLGGRKSECKSCQAERERTRLKQINPEIVFRGKYNSWNKNKINKKIIELYESGFEINNKNMRDSKYRGVYDMACYYNGSWERTLSNLGIDPKLIYKRWCSSKNDIKVEIIKIHNKNETLQCSVIKVKHPKLYSRAVRLFGSWKSAIIYSGIDYASFAADWITESHAGIEFEMLIKELLDVLGSKFRHNKLISKSIRPDFSKTNGVWIDAKLSSWTIFNCETMKKYEPHCRMLTIVFMRGDSHEDKMLSNKTRSISVYKLIKQLPTFKQARFTEWISRINALLINEPDSKTS